MKESLRFTFRFDEIYIFKVMLEEKYCTSLLDPNIYSRGVPG